MAEKFYTIDQIAELLGMHHKTIRKFIREGQLGASKVGKQWRISGHALSVFMEGKNLALKDNKTEPQHSFAVPPMEAPIERVQVSAVVDIGEVSAEEYLRLSNTLIAIANSKSPQAGSSTIQVRYDHEDKRIKAILWGSISFIEYMLSSVTMLMSQEK